MTLRSDIANGYRKVYQLMEWSRYREALDETRKLIAESPDDADAYALLGQVYHRMDNYGEALKWSQESLKLDPENKIAWFVRVCTYYDSGNFGLLPATIEEAQRIDPYEPQYYYLKANLCNKARKFAEARENMRQALELQPENPLFLAVLAYIEALLKNDESSLALERQALRLSGESAHVFLHLGWAAGERADHGKQSEFMKNAVRLEPESKQIRQEYLESLQRSYVLYRMFLYPIKLIRKLKPWQIYVSWVVLFLLFRPVIFALIFLYILSHWGTKLLVHVKVFGWRRRG